MPTVYKINAEWRIVRKSLHDDQKRKDIGERQLEKDSVQAMFHHGRGASRPMENGHRKITRSSVPMLTLNKK
jgi:hypothetical protein